MREMIAQSFTKDLADSGCQVCELKAERAALLAIIDDLATRVTKLEIRMHIMEKNPPSVFTVLR